MLKPLEEKLTKHADAISAWFAKHSSMLNDPVYASVDLRHSGFKIAPIDTNIFPAGWNNLCPAYSRKAGENFKIYFQKHFPTVRRIVIVPESHTKNPYYLENVKNLRVILEMAGFLVQEWRIEEPLVEGDLYLLNNDLSIGVPDVLKTLKKPLIPTPEIGWHTRRKSDHFVQYNMLIEEFCRVIDLDPWLLSTYVEQTIGVDFANRQGLELVAEKVHDVLEKIKTKYKEYKIEELPFVFIKNEAGTYGMAIVTATDAHELFEMSRSDRNKMNVGKGNIKVSSVIIQEGVPTVDRFKGEVAEPVIYLAGNETNGGFLRLHGQKNQRESLNAPGATFTKMCFHEMKDYSSTYNGESLSLETLTKIFNLLARIASMAAGYEILSL